MTAPVDAAPPVFSTWSAKNQHLAEMTVHTEVGYRYNRRDVP